MVTKIGLDLGYANITLSDVMAEIYREPSVALIYKNARPDARRIISVGSAAVNSDGEAIGGARMEISRCDGGVSCERVVVGGYPLPGVDDTWKGCEYRIVTNNYLAQGNDGLLTMVQGYDRKEYDLTLRELVLDYISALHMQGRAVDAAVDGRVKIVECD